MSETYGIIRLAKTKSAAVHAAQYHNDRLPGEHSNPDIKPHLHELNQEFLVHGKYEDEIAERTKDLKKEGSQGCRRSRGRHDDSFAGMVPGTFLRRGDGIF